MDAERARGEAREILEALGAIKMRKADRGLWAALVLGRWFEARALAPQRKIYEPDPRDIAAGLAHRGRGPEVRARDFVIELHRAAEAGEPVRSWLRVIAEERGMGPEEGAEDQGGERGGDLVPCAARPPQLLARPRVDQPRDLAGSDRGLRAAAQALGRQLPAPEVAPRGTREYIGAASATARGLWLAWVAEVQARWPAPLRLDDLCAMAPGADRRWLAAVLGEHKAALSRGLTEERRRELALGMIGEAEAIAREALRLSAESEDERLKMAALKIGLEALGRRSALAGLDKVSLELRAEVQGARSPEEVARAMGLSPSALAAIGDAASAALSRPGAADREE